MGAVSLLRFRRVPDPWIAARVLLAVLFVGLVLLAFAVLLGVTSPGHSPASEPVLVGPFRWPGSGAAA